MIVTVVVVLSLVALGGGTHLFGFLSQMSGRGLQIEAVGATPLLWLTQIGVTRIQYSHEILTFELAGPGVAAVGAVLTPLMALGVVVVAVLALLQLRAGASVRGCCRRPCSPGRRADRLQQGRIPAVPGVDAHAADPVVAVRPPAGAGPGDLLLVDYALTQAVYPIAYDELLRAEPLAIALLSARNVMVVVICVIAIRALVRTPVHRPEPRRS